MNCKLGLYTVLSLMVAGVCLVESDPQGKLRNLRNKYRKIVDSGGLLPPAFSSGGGAAAAASAGYDGVSSSVAASAAGGGYGHQARQQPHYQQQAAYAPPSLYQRPVPQYYQPPVEVSRQYGQPKQPHNRAPVYREPAQYYARQPAVVGGSASAAAAAGYYAPQTYHQAPQYYPPAPQPQRKHPHQHPHHPRHQHQPHYAESQQYAQSQRAPVYQPSAGVASSASAAAVSSGGHGRGGAASAASATSAGAAAAGGAYYEAPEHNYHTVDKEELNERYNEPETEQHYEASAGTYSDGHGGLFEEGSYARDTESIENHEDGREDGDHYYNAHAYGKTGDVNKYVAYANDDEDILHTPNVFHKKKSNTNYVSNFNKQHRETGSGVIAHDKHSASYNKNSKKLKENVDQRYKKQSDGKVETKDFNSHADVDDEEEEKMDTRGLGNFVGVDGVLHAKRPQNNNPAAAAAASATASFQAGARH